MSESSMRKPSSNRNGHAPSTTGLHSRLSDAIDEPAPNPLLALALRAPFDPSTIALRAPNDGVPTSATPLDDSTILSELIALAEQSRSSRTG